jgi:nucleoside 2-deoxyribosyltransferase
MSIYVASSWRNKYYEGVVSVLKALKQDVYDFRDTKSAFHWKELDPKWEQWTVPQYAEALCLPKAEVAFDNDFGALKAADCLILVIPCGASAHLEAGYATGAGKPVYIYYPDGYLPEPELMYKMCDRILCGHDMLKAFFGENQGSTEVVEQDGRHGGLPTEVAKEMKVPMLGRYNCKCGAWIMLPPTNTKDNPQVCEGIVQGGDGKRKTCGRLHYWEGDKAVIQEVASDA